MLITWIMDGWCKNWKRYASASPAIVFLGTRWIHLESLCCGQQAVWPDFYGVNQLKYILQPKLFRWSTYELMFDRTYIICSSFLILNSPTCAWTRESLFARTIANGLSCAFGFACCSKWNITRLSASACQHSDCNNRDCAFMAYEIRSADP